MSKACLGKMILPETKGDGLTSVTLLFHIEEDQGSHGGDIYRDRKGHRHFKLILYTKCYSACMVNFIDIMGDNT